MITCPRCGGFFADAASFDAHYWGEEGIADEPRKGYECSPCGEDFATLAEFDAHLPADPEATLACQPVRHSEEPQSGPCVVYRAETGGDSRNPENDRQNRRSEGVEYTTLVQRERCPQGHPLEGRNVLVQGRRQQRTCRRCHNERQRAYRQRRAS